MAEHGSFALLKVLSFMKEKYIPLMWVGIQIPVSATTSCPYPLNQHERKSLLASEVPLRAQSCFVCIRMDRNRQKAQINWKMQLCLFKYGLCVTQIGQKEVG